MARKFQTGDTVQVVKDSMGDSLDSDFKIDHKGVVVEYKAEYAPQSYKVKRKINKRELWFSVPELKLIKRVDKKQKK